MFLNDIVGVTSVNFMHRVGQTLDALEMLVDLREMVLVLYVVHGRLQSLQSRHVTLQLLESVLMEDVIARSEESFQFGNFLFYLGELMIPFYFVDWT